MTIKLSLDIQDVNIVLQALMQGPYQQVANVISTIETQAKSQLPSATEVEEVSGE